MQHYNYNEFANDVINLAFSEARDLGHQYIGTEHILLGLSLIKGSKVSETFLYYKITAKDIRNELIKLIGVVRDFEGIVDYTLRAKECLERSHQFALKSNNAEILPEHLFMSILADKESIGYKVLTKLSLDVTKITHDYQTTFAEGSTLIKAKQAGGHDVKTLSFDEDYAESERKILNLVGTNLTELVKDQPLEVTVGRENEIDRLIQILTRKTKNSPCLIGEPGVGKSAIIRGLASKIATGNVPDALKGYKIIEINLAQLLAGTMYRGQFEEKMNELITALREDSKCIAYFDEFQNLMGAGSTGDKSMDALSMLKPHLSSGDIQMIGATTHRDYHKYIESDHAITRRLTLVQVEEPSPDETLLILSRVKANYERHHQVVIKEDALKAAVDLSIRYIRDRKLPDKAIDIIDEACSRKRSDNLRTMEIVEELKYRLSKLKEEKESLILELQFEKAAKIQQEEKRILGHIEKNQNAKSLLSSQKLTVEQDDIERVVSEWAQVPIHKLSTHDKERLNRLYDLMKDKIIGQEEAIEMVSKTLKRFRVGIKSESKPVGNFLFVGPTGVGKTELAKVIADIYFGSDKNLIKIDMSEYTEKHAIAKLIGSPPGYEGTKEGGYLTNAIAKMPFSVVLFDEIEKADTEVINVLLQLMDEGTVTDGRGISYDFRNALIIMTSNLGTSEILEKQMGFIKTDEIMLREERIREACKKYFKPEFINRIDEIIVFKPLKIESLREIVKLKLDDLAELLDKKNYSLEWTEDVAMFLAEKSFTEDYGARPINRIIDKWVKDPIADVMLSLQAENAHLRLDVEDNEIIIKEVEDVEE